jgi:VWFA-related protein
VPANPAAAAAKRAIGEGRPAATVSGAPPSARLPPAQPQVQTGAGQPLFRSSVTGVSVSVSVLAAGSPVAGLTSSDFELLDDGVPQKIGAFSVESQPVDVSLLLDLSGSVEGPRLQRLKRGVVETSQLLAREDRLRLIAVQHQLQQVFGFQPAGTTPALDRLAARGGTALADALAAAMIRIGVPDRRHLIVAYTDGADTISILSPDTVREVAGFADALVHVVVPTSPDRRRPAGAPAPASWLSDVTTRTGGQVFEVDSEAPIGAAFTRAIEEFRTSYVLRYLPAGVKAGGWHDISVRVKTGAYEVRARKGYSGG